MKKRFLAVLILPTLLLSSCLFFSSTQTFEKEIDVYDIDRLNDEGNLSSGYQTTLKTRYIGGREYIPYVTIQDYASLYESHYDNNVTNTFEKVGYLVSWVVKKGDDPYFQAIIDYAAKTISFAGDLEAVYKSSDDPRDLKALNYGLKTSGEGEALSDTQASTFSYREYKMATFVHDKEIYLPLGLLDVTFSNSTGIYFTYNYAHIMSTREVDNYASLRYIDKGIECTFDTQMEANKRNSVIPSYLVEYNASLFLYLMDNLYGLKQYYGINSMVSYYKKVGIYNNLFTTLGSERGQAYLDALSILDDNHTTLVSVNSTWGENELYGIRYGQRVYNRTQLRKDLRERRTRVYEDYKEDGSPKVVKPGKDILYSQDGKTAMFSFDSFVFGQEEQVFNTDGTIKETAKDYDTYFKILDVLKTVKGKETVENVIFDISVNGGGVVGVMLKLLALISKTNTTSMSFYDDTNSYVSIYTSSVDSNDDQQYDAKDCFGNDLKFYILTSDCSFSCGNAFPSIAQLLGDAKIIGQKSGGGECVVAVHYLPNSEYVYHSSNTHIGYFDKANHKFIGFESGATPDISLSINDDFYSIEALSTAIKNAN